MPTEARINDCVDAVLISPSDASEVFPLVWPGRGGGCSAPRVAPTFGGRVHAFGGPGGSVRGFGRPGGVVEVLLADVEEGVELGLDELVARHP